MKTRRSREDILVGILKACYSDKLTITRLMAILNLQHRKLTDYLEHLAKSNLIEYQKRNGRTIVATTDKGADAVRSYRNAIALLNGHYLTGSTDSRVNERQNSQSIPA